MTGSKSAKVEPIEPVEADPFDVEALRLGSSFEVLGVKKELTVLPVGKPDKQVFFRTHPAEVYRLETGLLELREEREFYLVRPEMRAELAEELVFVRLYLTMSRSGALSLWPIRLPGLDGKRNLWHDSAEKAATLAMRRWIRLVPNQAAGMYDTFTATASLPEPEWPELSMRELLKLAFGERFIGSVDHPVVRRLRGQA
jgi:hypothetical protein